MENQGQQAAPAVKGGVIKNCRVARGAGWAKIRKLVNNIWVQIAVVVIGVYMANKIGKVSGVNGFSLLKNGICGPGDIVGSGCGALVALGLLIGLLIMGVALAVIVWRKLKQGKK